MFTNILKYFSKIPKVIMCWFDNFKKNKGKRTKKRRERKEIKLFVQSVNLVSVKKVVKEKEKFLQNQVIKNSFRSLIDAIIVITFGQ